MNRENVRIGKIREAWHFKKVAPRKDKRSVDLIGDARGEKSHLNSN
jgi:hypothetical protein